MRTLEKRIANEIFTYKSPWWRNYGYPFLFKKEKRILGRFMRLIRAEVWGGS
jgi:hypothetical protein